MQDPQTLRLSAYLASSHEATRPLRDLAALGEASISCLKLVQRGRPHFVQAEKADIAWVCLTAIVRSFFLLFRMTRQNALGASVAVS